MPRRIQGPDGKLHEFPDDFTNDEIASALDSVMPHQPESAATQRETAPSSGVMDTALDVGVGAIKGAAKTAVGVGELVSQIPGVSHAIDAAYGPGVRRTAFDWARARLQPANTAEKIGQGIEQTAEFFGPGSALKGAKAAMALRGGRAAKLANAVTGLGVEGASAAAVDAAQKGTTADALSTGLTSAGVGGAIGATVKGAQLPARWLSERIEASLLKPLAGALEGQTPAQMVKNLYKHKLGGSLDQSYAKVNQRLAEKSAELKAALTADPAARVKLAIIAGDTAKQYAGNKKAIEALDAIREAVEFELNKRGVQMGNGVLDLAEANVAKQAVGELGAWMRDPSGRVLDNSSRYIEDVANAFYKHLKTAIESKSTGPIAAINKDLSELIPIKAAIVQRIPVEQRANLLKASDVASALGTVFEPSAMAVGIGNRLLGSGRAANTLNKFAGRDANAAASAATRLTGAMQ